MARILLSLADLGAAMPLQEMLERGGHEVRWDADSAKGPTNNHDNPEIVIVDADVASSTAAATAWRDHDPPPSLLLIGTSSAAQLRANQVQCRFVATNASPVQIEQEIKAALKMRFAGRMSGPFARAVLSLGTSIDRLSDARNIVIGSREVDLELARECLRWHAHKYVMVDADGLAQLRDSRTLNVPELNICEQLDGTRTVQTLVSSENGAAVGRLLWGLISSNMASCEVEPPDQRTAARQILTMTRRHLVARNERLTDASHYEVLEVTPDANEQSVDYAARVLAVRYAPERLANLDLATIAPLAKRLWQQVLSARTTLMNTASRGTYNDALSQKRDKRKCSWAFDITDQDQAAVFFERGQTALVAGDSSKAVSNMAGACRNHPDHPVYEAYLCWARFRSGIDKDQDRALLAQKERYTAEKLLLGRRPWPNALVALALLCTADKDQSGARYHLQEALQIDPNLPVAKQLLGRFS